VQREGFPGPDRRVVPSNTWIARQSLLKEQRCLAVRFSIGCQRILGTAEERDDNLTVTMLESGTESCVQDSQYSDCGNSPDRSGTTASRKSETPGAMI
jgi:hypothetical protein